jgi:hypothetical protein
MCIFEAVFFFFNALSSLALSSFSLLDFATGAFGSMCRFTVSSFVMLWIHSIIEEYEFLSEMEVPDFETMQGILYRIV